MNFTRNQVSCYSCLPLKVVPINDKICNSEEVQSAALKQNRKNLKKQLKASDNTFF